MQAASNRLVVGPTTLAEHDAATAAQREAERRTLTEISSDVARQRFTDPDIHGPAHSSYALVLYTVADWVNEQRNAVSAFTKDRYTEKIAGARTACFFLVDHLDHADFDSDVEAVVAEWTKP